MRTMTLGTAGKVMLIVSAVCGVLAILAAYTWAAPCVGTLELANGKVVPMRCAYTTKIAVLLALMLIAVTLVTLFARIDLRIALLLIALGMIVITFESFIGIGVCKSEMACWTTAFWVRGLSGVSIVATLASYVFSGSRKQVED